MLDVLQAVLQAKEASLQEADTDKASLQVPVLMFRACVEYVCCIFIEYSLYCMCIVCKANPQLPVRSTLSL